MTASVHDVAGQPVPVSMTVASGAVSLLASPADVVGHAGVLALIGVGFVAAGILLIVGGRRRRHRPGPGPVARRRWWQW